MKKLNVAQKLIQSHLVSGEMIPGTEIGLKIDHILQQDATGTMIMLELEKIGIDKVTAEVAVQYVDHNLLQTDFKNADDHVFLQSAAKKFGYWFSRPGNGISHVVHMERFGKPGKSMIGSDSHTCSAGSMGMLAIGAGGLDVATAAAGEPFYITMPKIFGVELTGELPDWVSAKDIILEMLRRYDVKGGVGYIIEYFGEGVKTLSAWDRHVIANMGAELGATTTVFPSDDMTWVMLKQENRGNDWQGIVADEGAEYDKTDRIHLPDLVPLIAKPSSPGNVVPVYEVDGLPISQVVVGSSANPGLRDFWMVSEIVKGKDIPPEVSLDINPSSRQKIEDLGKMGAINSLIQSGARFHQTGCMGCIGMGQAPASNTVSLRTMPRNFPGRSGTADDQVYLCSPETAAVSALYGKITNPRKYEKHMKYPKYEEPENASKNTLMLIPPAEERDNVALKKGPNIKSLPDFDTAENTFRVPVALKMGDNISTDEILKAGAEVLPLRSNIEAISRYAYYVIDDKFYEKAMKLKSRNGGHVVVAGENYAQGSSREHAAIAPRYLGQKAVIAKSYARIGFQNLVNYGVVPFLFHSSADYNLVKEGDFLEFDSVMEAIKDGKPIDVYNVSAESHFKVYCLLTNQQISVLLKGGLINHLKLKKGKKVMYKIVLLRHGESIWNQKNLFTGWTDVGLSEKGTEEAKNAGKILAANDFKFDYAFVSLLKRSLQTLWLTLEELDQLWIPWEKSWRLNERHYGALQGLDKIETSSKYGKDQVHQWRRGYKTKPPQLEKGDKRFPGNERKYQHLSEDQLPLGESLEDTVNRFLPYWMEQIVPTIKTGKKVIIAAHGNSLRALVKHLEKISDDDIPSVEIPTGIPLIYELDDNMMYRNHYYLK